MRRRPSAHLPWALFLFLILVSFCAQNLDRQSHPGYHYKTPETTEANTIPSVVRPAPRDLAKFGYPVAKNVVGPFHILVNQGYVCGYDSGIQDPRWVETRFFSVPNPVSTARPKEFSTDPRIEPQFQVSTHEWTDSGYDRGHMAPNYGVSICYGREAQVETFLLTNVIPQAPHLNRGLWESLEKIITNDYAERFGAVWVICGPVFDSHPETLQDGRIWIPKACFKIVLRIDNEGSPRCLAFEMPQDISMGHKQTDLLQYLTSVAKIEAETGIKFFPDLAEPSRLALENQTATALW